MRACPLGPPHLVGHDAVVAETHHSRRAASCWAAVDLVSGGDDAEEEQEAAEVGDAAGADVDAGRGSAEAENDGREG